MVWNVKGGRPDRKTEGTLEQTHIQIGTRGGTAGMITTFVAHYSRVTSHYSVN